MGRGQVLGSSTHNIRDQGCRREKKEAESASEAGAVARRKGVDRDGGARGTGMSGGEFEDQIVVGWRERERESLQCRGFVCQCLLVVSCLVSVCVGESEANRQLSAALVRLPASPLGAALGPTCLFPPADFFSLFSSLLLFLFFTKPKTTDSNHRQFSILFYSAGDSDVCVEINYAYKTIITRACYYGELPMMR